jgi:hypothetical protein
VLRYDILRCKYGQDIEMDRTHETRSSTSMVPQSKGESNTENRRRSCSLQAMPKRCLFVVSLSAILRFHPNVLSKPLIL